MALTAKQIEQAKPAEKDYKLSDSGGLFLLVKKTGAKYWRYKYRHLKKEKQLAIGVYPDVSLSEAREQHQTARKALKQGIDPSADKKAKKAAGIEAAANSFELISHEWFSTKMASKSEGHQKRTMRMLKNDLFPRIGNQPIDAITSSDLLKALRRIEARGAMETAYRTKQIAGQIFRYAIATERAERDPSADLKEALTPPVSKHFASITDPKEVGKLLIAIDAYSGTTTVKAALSLSPLLFCRPGELRKMEWREINWDTCQWELPANKMKMNQPHVIPLSHQALTILREQQLLTGRGRYVLPCARGASRPLSENGVRVALRTMGYNNETITPHGFRAMARTLLDEVLEYRIEWIECQLAHAVKDANGRAYNRTTYLKQRTEMMQRWADYLDELKYGTHSNVVSFAGGA